jgi:hypothetical protein
MGALLPSPQEASMSALAPSDLARRGRLVRLALALVAAVAVAAPARAAQLRPAERLPESQRHLLADTTASAVDHVRAARRAIAERRAYDARKELAQASTLLTQSRGASPATRVAQEISALQIQLQDPTAQVSAQAFDPLFAAIDDAGDREAFAATRTYVERARYFRRDGVAASTELTSAAARIPQGEIDGPLADAFAQVQVASVAVYAGDLPAADRVLARAEQSALAAVRIAAGDEADWLADVAAPPPEAPAVATPEPDAQDEGPPITETEIPAPAEFQESNEPAPSGP